jgi:hypothetical protein
MTTRYASARPGRFETLGTLEKPAAHLDAKSMVALDWLRFWVNKHESREPPPSVVIRVALQVLAQHCSSIDGNEVSSTVRRFRDAGKGSGSATTLTEARARIENHLRAPGAQPLDHWEQALHSQADLTDKADFLQRMEAHMAGLFPSGL